MNCIKLYDYVYFEISLKCFDITVCVTCHPSLYLQGIDFLEPFIPIEVTKYSEEEIQKVMDYYEDRRWIQQPEGRHIDSFYITFFK